MRCGCACFAQKESEQRINNTGRIPLLTEAGGFFSFGGCLDYMKNRRLIALLLSLVCTFVLIACGKENNEPPDGNTPPVFAGASLTLAKSGTPDYSAHEGELMPIGAWNPSPSVNYVYTAEELSAAQEAGIRFLCDVRASKYTNKEKLAKAMDAIEKSGMQTIINLSGLSYADVLNDDLPYGALKSYINKDFFKGFNFWDEPGTGKFADLQQSAEAFAHDYPNKTGYVNLLPNYATQGQMGITGAQSHKDYVQSFAETVTSSSVLSYDFYPLAGQMSNGEVMEHSLNGLWLGSLENMANAAKASNKDLWVFIQCMDFNNTNRAPQSVADITLQNYVNMCYGARGLQYFSLTTPPNDRETFGPAMLDRELEKTDNFTYVKAANEELQSFAYAYLQFTWDNVMPVEGKVITDVLSNGFDLLTTHMRQSDDFAVTSNMDALVGQFHDANGYKGYMVSRISDPMDGLMSTTSMTFNATRVLVYANGTCEIVEIPTGVYEFTMEAGEGRFIIPFNE